MVFLWFSYGLPMVFHPMMFPNVHRSPDEFFAGTGPQPQQKLDTEDQRSQRLAAPPAHRPMGPSARQLLHLKRKYTLW